MKEQKPDLLARTADIIDDTRVFDLEKSIELCGGDRRLANDLLLMLYESIEDNKSFIEQLFIREDKDALIQILHKLSGSFVYCHFEQLNQRNQILHNALKNRAAVSTVFIDQLYRQFLRELNFLIRVKKIVLET